MERKRQIGTFHISDNSDCYIVAEIGRNHHGRRNHGRCRRAYETIISINLRLCIMQCTAGYPPPYEELSLKVIITYREDFLTSSSVFRHMTMHRYGAARHDRHRGSRAIVS